MTVKTSTGLANKMLDTGSVKSIMDGGLIKIYAGAVPATADDAVGSATLLCTITASGSGLTLGAAADRAIPKEASEVWSGVNVAGGVATFYRHVAPGDTGAASVTQPRAQGLIAQFGSDMNFTLGTTLANGATQSLQFYQFYLPSA